MLRSALKEDLKEIYNLVCELEGQSVNFQDFEHTYLDNLENKNIYYIVAEDKDKLVGFISLHIQNLLHHVGKISEIQELIVLDTHRGLGIGKVLFDEVKRISTEMGCIQLEVCCNCKRGKSHSFYLSQNMKKSHYKFTYDLKVKHY